MTKHEADLTNGQREALKTFVRECLAGYVDGCVGDLDGGWLQDRAIELGLLVESGDEDDPLYYIVGWLLPQSPAVGRGPLVGEQATVPAPETKEQTFDPPL